MKSYSVREEIPSSTSENLKDYPELLRKLLHYRGITEAEQAHSFLNPDYENHVHDPFLLKDMDKAVERILRAIENNERILIYSDYDADGIPAAVVLFDFFKMVGYGNVEVYIPHRHNEGYGLHLEAIDTFKDRIKLVITLDCGIVDNAEVKHAKAHGIDVIITDHHTPSETLPEAYAVINPKRADCNYPYKMLCGAGVGYKLVQGLLISLRGLRESSPSVSAGSIRATTLAAPTFESLVGKNSRVVERGEATRELNEVKRSALPLLSSQPKIGQEKWLLDMVGLATLSDMVPLDGENRVFAHYGLKVLRKSRRPGFTKLLSIIKVNKDQLTEDDVGFMITPRINAASRMGVPSDAFHLLSTENNERADELAKHLDSINKERKTLVAVTVKEIKKILLEREDHFREKSVIVLGNPLWRPALLGLAANTIAEEHGKPVFLWGRESLDGIERDIKGSCRSGGAVNIMKLMQAAAHLFKEFGGHSFSGGYAIDSEKIHTFEQELLEVYEKIKGEKVPDPVLYADAILSLDDVTPATYSQIEKLAPFGTGNPKPLFMFKNISPAEIKMFGKNKEHLELTFQTGISPSPDKERVGVRWPIRKIRAIGFFVSPEDFKVNLSPNVPLTLIASLEKSYFGRYPELRLRIVDII